MGYTAEFFWNFLFSMSLLNGEYFKHFKFFDLTWIWWIRLEWSEAIYLLKVSNKDTTVIIKSCSKWKYRSMFLHLYWNLQQASQTIFVCLLPPLSIICIEMFHSFQHCFYKIKFIFLDFLTLIFLLYSDCSKCVRF